MNAVEDSSALDNESNYSEFLWTQQLKTVRVENTSFVLKQMTGS